jgi:hypothetical protein
MNYDTNKRNTCFIYKNDLKFNNEINLEDSEFESDSVKQIYNNFKNKPKIELRIEDSKMENYKYLDLSKLDIDDDQLTRLFELDKIKYILKKIEFLDLAHNELTFLPNLKKYPNILYLSVSFNKINHHIQDDNLIELTCHNNQIKSIKSNKLTHLNASYNDINLIDVPNINVLVINYNNLNWIASYLELKYLECISNEITKIDNMINLEELYIGENNVNAISNMPNLKVLNCVGNPLDKIKFFPNLKTLMSSTSKVSSQFVVSSISKIKSDFVITFIVQSN